MRVLHFSIFIILVSIMIIPNALSSHDSDKQWGTVSIDKPVLELPYTTASNAQYEKIKIFGIVEEPRSAAYVHMTISEPDGKTYQVKVRASADTNEQGHYENFILIAVTMLAHIVSMSSGKDIILELQPLMLVQNPNHSQQIH